MNSSAHIGYTQLAPGPPASWQMVFWILVSLSINAMAQPGGSVCGLPSRYRTYLRCSPFVCAADMLSILIRLLAFTLYQGLPYRDSLGILLHERFNGDSYASELRRQPLNLQASPTHLEGDGGDGIQSLERMTWLRWLWFLLGALPPGIKLVSMGGVGWTKTWGIILLSSWVVNELLIICATFNQSYFTISMNGRISWPGYEHTTRSPAFQKLQSRLNRLEVGISTIALIIHMTVLNVVYRIIWLFTKHVRRVTLLGYDKKYASPDYVLTISLCAWIGMVLKDYLFQNQKIGPLWTLHFALFYIMLFSMTTNGIIYASLPVSPGHVWVISSVMISAFLWLTTFLGQRFTMLGKNLLLINPNSAEGEVDIDYGACLSLEFFLSTVIATVFWYEHLYDSSGTSVPVWTGVFG